MYGDTMEKQNNRQIDLMMMMMKLFPELMAKMGGGYPPAPPPTMPQMDVPGPSANEMYQQRYQQYFNNLPDRLRGVRTR
jgi:hypothetical protein